VITDVLQRAPELLVGLYRERARPAPFRGRHFGNKRIVASLGFRSAEAACRTIEGYKAVHLIRKGQIWWLPKGDVVGQRQFIHTVFGIAA
jgi:hypothetical protein